MKIFILTAILLTLPAIVFADKGVVVKEDVCGIGNSIIESTDGWYIAAEHYSGVYLYEGDVVYGKNENLWLSSPNTRRWARREVLY